MDILIFIFILLGLVIVHEWGHYIAAKKSGVRVEEFGFGIPPRVFGKKFGPEPKPGEEDDRTLFSLNLLPIGGFVRMTGEDSVYNDERDPKNFQNAKLINRMVIVLAGVFMNFIVGIGLFAIVYSYTGIPDNPPVIDVLVENVAENSPAKTVGLQSKDRIVSINDMQVKSSDALVKVVGENLDKEVNLVVMRGAREINVTVVPRSNPPEGQGALGVELGQDVRTTFYPWYVMPFHGIAAGMRDTAEMAKQIVPALSNLVGTIVMQQKVPEDVSGPVGIARASSMFCGGGILPCLQFAGLLSVNLAIFNLLPIPALDGGRLMFMIYEAITRRRASAKLEQWAHTIGFVLLLLLIVLVTYKDIFFGTAFK